MPITRRYSLSGGKPAGYLVRSAPQQITWFHGTTDDVADKVVRDQELLGEGDFGVGGYLSSSKEEALDWVKSNRHAYTGQQYPNGSMPDESQRGKPWNYPGLVVAELRPRRPWYGGHTLDPGPSHTSLQQDWSKMAERGADVYFPLGTGPRNPGNYAVVLDSRSANFTKGALLSSDVLHPSSTNEGFRHTVGDYGAPPVSHEGE